MGLEATWTADNGSYARVTCRHCLAEQGKHLQLVQQGRRQQEALAVNQRPLLPLLPSELQWAYPRGLWAGLQIS
jgi:hypothetical protein